MFQYYHDIKNDIWIVLLDGCEIKQFKTEEAAKVFCNSNNKKSA